MMKNSLSNRLFAGALIVAHVLLISCDKNPADAGDPQKPGLPPASSMNMDLSAFNNLGKSGAETGAPGLNFITARTTVAVINATMAILLAVPSLTFAAAISQQPVLMPDGKFHWVYTVADGPRTFQADLAGWIDTQTQESVWEMRLTTSGNNPPLSNFLWYSGRARLDATSGYWDIFDASQPASSVKVLRIDWQAPGSSQATLQFTAVAPGVPQAGDSLTYSANGAARAIVYNDVSAATQVQIAWDAVTLAGYLIAPNYNNGQKSCWDAQLNDSVCP